jgi:hypothetical protein
MNWQHQSPISMRAGTCAAAVLLSLALAGQALSAPAPFETSRRSKALNRADLFGTWTMTWANQRSTVTLSPCGGYRCLWHGVTFTGTWKLDEEGRFCIRETASVNTDTPTYHTFTIRFEPGSRIGQVELGNQRIEVRLDRPR